MIIKDKIVWVYDIEVFPNVFSCIVKNTETKEYQYFEISVRKNNVSDLIEFFSDCDNKLICGYNNIHYDNPVINYILAYKNQIKTLPYLRVCDSLFTLSNIIINSDNTDKWKQWKYANNFETLDLLTMMFSQALRCGLKEMQVTMQYPNVQEYEGDFSLPLPTSEIDTMLAYNKNDVDSTEELLYRCEKQIQLRLGIQNEYGIKALSSDGVSIGNEILKTKYLQDTHQNWYDVKDLRSPCDMVELKKVILPIIEFKTKILQNLLKEMKTLIVSPGRKGWNKQFWFYDSVISIGVGGLHSIEKPQIYIPNEDEEIRDLDAASLYPSLLINWNFAPKHLGTDFLKTYSNIKDERIEAKHNGNKIKNETLKLALNAVTGLMQNEYSWLYSPEDVLRIRMNGQLLLLMIGERLILETNCKVINWNTDGIYIIIKKDKIPLYNQIIKEFEQLSRLQFEDEIYTALYQYAGNDYLAVEKKFHEANDYKHLKRKGLFIDTVTLGKGMQPVIIPKALTEYFINGIPIEETIQNCKNLNDFITYQKVNKDYKVEYNGKLISRINRYYASTNGNYLFKCKVDVDGRRTDYNHMLKASGVTIVNNLNDVKEFPTNINYNYYISEANKIITQCENRQLSLF